MFLSSPEEACPCQFNVDEGSAEIEGPAEGYSCFSLWLSSRGADRSSWYDSQVGSSQITLSSWVAV